MIENDIEADLQVLVHRYWILYYYDKSIWRRKTVPKLQLFAHFLDETAVLLNLVQGAAALLGEDDPKKRDELLRIIRGELKRLSEAMMASQESKNENPSKEGGQ